jgi:(1->4)-alpha-D-glucan 1-alpha-D-glucosylmutase
MRIPVSTYRIQLRPGFGFSETAAILPYLNRLGISDVYASPLFAAQPGSLHGYDVIDPLRLNPELGSGEAWRTLTQSCSRLGMGWVQDIVPNHMAFSGQNGLLADIFENGPQSVFYHFFDIQWQHPYPHLSGRVRAPFLGDTLDTCLSRGEIALHYGARGLAIAYFDHLFAVTLGSYGQVFEPMQADAEQAERSPEIDVWRRGVQQLIQVASAGASEDRSARIADAKQALWELYNRSRRVTAWVDARVSAFNDAQGRARLKHLLESQHFELCAWHTAGSEINYRRFFSINGLIGVRQEHAPVFDYTHRLIQTFIDEGQFTGLRIDHIDGLADPGAYLTRLREVCGDTYIVVEKILAPGEALVPAWPVQGTTGYEFAAQMNALFTWPDQEADLTVLYQKTTGNQAPFEEIGRQSKQEILEKQFAGDLVNLTLKFAPLTRHAEQGGSPSPSQLSAGLAQILINMPVYRTYLAAAEILPGDIDIIGRAVAAARRQRPDLETIFDLLLSGMVGASRDKTATEREQALRRAVSAFEQLAAALAAKGIEDTALYRYNRLSALNEVGGAVEHFDGSRDAFDHFAAHRLPHTLNALSTHDTKRSADVRARMLVITELAAEWASHVARWRQFNHDPAVISTPVPDPEMAYLLYQTLIGTFPENPADLERYAERIAAYALKAAREAKQHTRWSTPDLVYEAALQQAVKTMLSPANGNRFLDDMAPFAAKVARLGRYTALSQCLIHLTAPGVPDIYQGSELFDDSLVDPDNRRDVDFTYRESVLEALIDALKGDQGALAAQLAADNNDRTKLYVTYITLQLRRRNPELFLRGGYEPLTPVGRYGRHVVAFARKLFGQWVVTVVPRFLNGLIAADQPPVGPSVWADTHITLPATAPEHWFNHMTGETLSGFGLLTIADLLAKFPVALVTGEEHT